MIDNLFVYDIENDREGYIEVKNNTIYIHYSRYGGDSEYLPGNVCIGLSVEETEVLIKKLSDTLNHSLDN